MNFAPLILSICFMYFTYDAEFDSWLKLISWTGIYSLIYILLLYKLSMNQYERTLFVEPIKKILQR